MKNSIPPLKHTYIVMKASKLPLNHRSPPWVQRVQHQVQQVVVLQKDEPTSYLTTAKDREWLKAMKVESDAIEKNQTWSLVDLPAVRKPIGLKCVYKLKRDPSGNILKHKARLIAKGYVQKPRVDFDEVFAPVARIETIRILLALASSHGWKVHHLDVKSAFLHGRLEEE
ncbi:ribonuclease H-like domain, reverse transcriptase, RNA-dependent DNA polymerase, partial [Tanacetum coccineum]